MPHSGHEMFIDAWAALATWEHAFQAKAAWLQFQARGGSPEVMPIADKPDHSEELPIPMILMKNVSIGVAFRESREEVGAASDRLVSKVTDLFEKLNDIMLSSRRPVLDAAAAALNEASQEGPR